MKTILTPKQIYDLIFSVEENYNHSVVKESDIAIVESRYLLPIVCESLYNALLEGEHTELCSDYVAPMLGAWTRYVVEPLLAERCGMGHGAVVVDSERMTHLRSMASMLTRRLSDYLNAKQDECQEYNPCCNPINYCSIDGGIVQIY
jgi:hypothetical protein